MEIMTSKAELKRQKELKSRLESLIGNVLKGFKSEFLSLILEFRLNEVQIKIDEMEEAMINRDPMNFRTPDFTRSIERLKSKLKRTHLTSFEYMSEANEMFQKRFDKLISKLVSFKMKTQFLRVKAIRNNGSGFEFLISNNEMEVHARIIYANGEINVPHYRFITTKRNK